MGHELLKEPMVFREQGSGTQVMVDNYLSATKMDIQNIRTVARVSSPEVTKQLVERGTGVAILSNLTVQDEVEAGRLLQFELDEKPVSRKIYMVYRKKGNMGELAREFVTYVISRTRQGSDSGREYSCRSIPSLSRTLT